MPDMRSEREDRALHKGLVESFWSKPSNERAVRVFDPCAIATKSFPMGDAVHEHQAPCALVFRN